MRFDIYGRFVLEISDPGTGWLVASRRAAGKRQPVPDIVIPDTATPNEIVHYLEAHYHEMGRPGEEITPLP